MALFDKNDSAELVVLALLREAPKYGYLLTKDAAARTDGQLRLTPGVLYPLLKQLERDGLIASTWEEVKGERADPDDAGRRRKWYRLTPKGRTRLGQRVEAHKAYLALIAAFMPGSPRAGEHA